MRVAEIWRYPIKSLRGESLREVNVLRDGIPGDRAVHVVDGDGELITARSHPDLLLLSATLGPDGEPLIDGHPWGGDQAAARTQSAAGTRARLVRCPGGHRFDDTELLVATDGAMAWMGRDRRRFRPNLLIEGVEGLAERTWPGSRLRVGEALLDVRRVCKRCVITTIDPDRAAIDPDVLRRINAELEGRFALNCEVVEPGRVAVGDTVELIPGELGCGIVTEA
jgi:uncharacterized protein